MSYTVCSSRHYLRELSGALEIGEAIFAKMKPCPELYLACSRQIVGASKMRVCPEVSVTKGYYFHFLSILYVQPHSQTSHFENCESANVANAIHTN